PIDGNWAIWSRWTACSTTCGTGHKSRTRSCTSPRPSGGGQYCTGTDHSSASCLTKICPALQNHKYLQMTQDRDLLYLVNGGWGTWTTWGSCDKSCDTGHQSRTRDCTHPAPKYGGANCTGDYLSTKTCLLKHCSVDGHWGSWSAYGACAVTCGSGKKTRHRSCDKPAPAHGGHTCSGSSTSDTTCLLGDCPVDGHWGSWSSYGACTVTCGTGKKARHRSCDSPAPAHGGQSCSGSSTSDTTCSLAACPVNGQWGTWSAYGACSVTCGAGNKGRHRSCDSPAPAHGGHSCSGPSTSDDTCSLGDCPVNGQWGTWSAYGACSVTCGAGNKVKHRSCDSPAPAHGGHTCSGSSTSQSTCSLGDCPVDGQWATWATWGACSVTCGSGTSTRTRGCHAPQYGGKPCNGHSTDQKTCTMVNCPVDGHWNSWSEYGTCDVTCGTGSQSRSRTCHEPIHGGKPCSGDATGTRSCEMTSCPVDGRWNTWSEWGTCGVTCGTGSQSRSRTCHEPRYGGNPCTGHSSDTKTCTMINCPVDGSWNTWSDWGKCDVTCGSGSQTRSRTCHEPTYGGKPCLGSRTGTKACTMVACPVDGHWSTWSDWATCDVTCGTGTHLRSRGCTNPAPKNGGRQCVGNSTDTEECEMVECPVDGGWGHWTAYNKCSQTCGGGQQARSRSCDNPTPKYGGKRCLGQSQHTQQCGTAPCVVDGVWSTWQAWSGCSVTCAGGNRTRTRLCDNPAPKNGGADCKGDNSGTEHCNTDACPTWSGWFAAPCSVTCGSGTRMRLRHCSSGTDSDCGSGNAFENLACMDQHCPVDGKWGEWKEWTTCSASCDQGTRSRSRDCDDPAPKYGGKQCVGSGSDEGMCQIKECPHWSSWQNVGKCSVTCGQGFLVLKRTCSTGNDVDCTGSSADERP
ncbi:HMCN1-like protein, partial [Mya arenaria]